MYIGFNNNPEGKAVGDCVVRAISKALGLHWEDAYIALVTEGYKHHDMPSSNYVWGMLLYDHGFDRRMPACSRCFTVEEFTRENPEGIFVIATDSHVVTAIDGDYFDSWDSGDKIVNYFWHKEE